MKLDVCLAPGDAANRPASGTLILVDVLRACTTICAALNKGASSILSVPHADIAREVRSRDPRILLAGEYRGKAIDDFDLDNSPASYRDVAGRDIVFCSTNLSRTLAALPEAHTVWLAALVNLNTVIDALVRDNLQAITVVCAGFEGSIAYEDVLCAGAITRRMRTHVQERVTLTDEAFIALAVYTREEKRLHRALDRSTSGRLLQELGYAKDIEAAASIDSVPILPVAQRHALPSGELAHRICEARRLLSSR